MGRTPKFAAGMAGLAESLIRLGKGPAAEKRSLTVWLKHTKQAGWACLACLLAAYAAAFILRGPRDSLSCSLGAGLSGGIFVALLCGINGGKRNGRGDRGAGNR